MVLREALHPGPSFVVDEQDGDALGGLDKEDARVEQVWHERRHPHRHHACRVVALLHRLFRLHLPLLLQRLLAVERHDLRQLGGPHLLARHLHRGPHAEEMDDSLAQHGEEDGRVEERLERPHRVHLLDGRGVGEGEGGDHQQPGGGDHLPLGGTGALQRERREDEGVDGRLEHHDLLLLQRREQRAPPLPNQVDNVLHRGGTRCERRGDRRIARPDHRHVAVRAHLRHLGGGIL
mmetsp:Transcript_57257/g.127810  ORF Transcript_57257/g.127810 Transcript_57257/m.127810 type:complete len:235 (-) Transcript_57257:8-712(-)